MTIAAAPAANLGDAAARLIRAAVRLLQDTRPGTTSASSQRAAATPAAPDTALRTYRVRSGDTAAAIALAHGICAASLLVRNGMRLRDEPPVGALLIVDSGEGGCRRAAADAPNEVRRHEVLEGEGLEELCERFRISPRILLTANGLSSGSCLTPGVTIVIPSSTDPRDTGEIPVLHDSGTGVSTVLS